MTSQSININKKNKSTNRKYNNCKWKISVIKDR